MTPAQYIQALNPTAYADPALATFIAIAENTLSRAFFAGSTNNNADLAVAFKTLHIYTLSKTRPLGESGTVGNKSEGQLSLGFLNIYSQTWVNDDLDQTHWGKQLKALIKQQSPVMSAIYSSVQQIESPTVPENLPPITDAP